MDLRHFFDGQQSRENSASAFLATLLDYDEAFRRKFLALEHMDPPVSQPLDGSETWTIKVEDDRPSTTALPDVKAGAGSIDITLESASTLVLVENKLVPSAKRHGQLLRYYEAATLRWPGKRIVALYVAPTVNLGNSEVRLVKECTKFRTRQAQSAGPDDAGSITWKDAREMILTPPKGDDWFARTGMNAVQAAIERAVRTRPFDLQREVVHRIVEAARSSLAAKAPGVQFRLWSGTGFEAIYTAKAQVTLFGTLRFDEEPEPSFKPRDVVVHGRVRLAVTTSFAPSARGPKSPALDSEWKKLVKAGAVKIAGVGDFSLVDVKSFEHRAAFDGTKDELEDLLVARGRGVLAFLSPDFTLAAVAGGTRSGLGSGDAQR